MHADVYYTCLQVTIAQKVTQIGMQLSMTPARRCLLYLHAGVYNTCTQIPITPTLFIQIYKGHYSQTTGVVSRNCQNFAALEGSPHENGYNSETKSRKMLPKVPKRPERRGLGPYSKKPKFLGQIFFWSFLAFFDHFLAVFGQNFMKERRLGKFFFLPVVQNGNPP